MVESLRRRTGQFGLDIVLVDLWEGAAVAEEATTYCEMWGLEGTVLLDTTAAFARAVGVRGVPTNVFVESDGTVRAVGATTSEELLRETIRLEPRLGGIEAEVLGSDRTSGFALSVES